LTIYKKVARNYAFMRDYSLVAVLWDDHTAASRTNLPKNPDKFITTVLSVGIILEETDKVIVLASEIERYDERDDVSYIVIIKSTIISIKKYGSLKIKKPRK
jgi:hypothetical protein